MNINFISVCYTTLFDYSVYLLADILSLLELARISLLKYVLAMEETHNSVYPLHLVTKWMLLVNPHTATIAIW